MSWQDEQKKVATGVTGYVARMEEGKDFTLTTLQPKREWVGLTPADFDKLEQLFGNKVSNDFVFADIVCVISAKLKEKNT